MASDVLVGILEGLGARHSEQRKNLLTEESDRRSKYEDFWKRQLEDPNVRPEAQEVAMNKLLEIYQTPSGKKLKSADRLDDFLNVMPKVGQSVQSPPPASTVTVPQNPMFRGVVPPTVAEIPSPQPPAQFDAVPARYTEDEQLNRYRQRVRVEGEETVRTAIERARGEAQAAQEFPEPLTMVPVPPQLQDELGEHTAPQTLASATTLASSDEVTSRAREIADAAKARTQLTTAAAAERTQATIGAAWNRTVYSADARSKQQALNRQLAIDTSELPLADRNSIAGLSAELAKLNELETLQADLDPVIGGWGGYKNSLAELRRWADTLPANNSTALGLAQNYINTQANRLGGANLTANEITRIMKEAPDPARGDFWSKVQAQKMVIAESIAARINTLTNPINREKALTVLRQQGIDTSILNTVGNRGNGGPVVSPYRVGQVIQYGGRPYRIVGIDASGELEIEPEAGP